MYNSGEATGMGGEKMKIVWASQIAALDSNVYTGGGTDVTRELQAALDMAGECGGVHLIMDGAALVKGLRVHSNTTIECLNRDCGFFQAPDSNRAIVSNYDWDYYERRTRNVVLKGGTYNQDCRRQKHDIPARESSVEDAHFLLEGSRWTFGLEFYGVEHLEIRDLTIRNFRTFAVAVGGFRNVSVENVWLDLPDHMDGQNQDGFHFWGPGRFLTVKNVGGRVGDDFMNIGPDELDGKSGIEDALVDGCFLDEADQAIRLLSHGTGTLDRVTIRNVSGTYKSFGFYINCWFPGKTYGDFRNIFIENVDLRQMEPNYTYRPPMLFNIGGNVESITVKNLRHHRPMDARALFEVGHPFYDLDWRFPEDNFPVIRHLLVDGLTIFEDGPAAAEADYIQVYQRVRHLAVKNVTVIRENTGKSAGHLIAVPGEQGGVDTLYVSDVVANGFDALMGNQEAVGQIHMANVFFRR